MNKITIDGVDCYGDAGFGMNYSMTFENEYYDGIVVDVEASGWKS